MQVRKRNGNVEDYNRDKIISVLEKVFRSTKHSAPMRNAKELTTEIHALLKKEQEGDSPMPIEKVQDAIRNILMKNNFYTEAEKFITYRANREHIRFVAQQQDEFIKKYMDTQTNADATVDDNSNVTTKNIATMGAEMWKPRNIDVNRQRVMNKIREILPDFDTKEYVRMLEDHIIYKNDENGQGTNPPYCVSVSMYRFLLDGLKGMDGKSATPKNLDSYCGLFCNFIFAVSTQFAGAVATSEFFLYFDYFARKEWGDDYWERVDEVISSPICKHQKTIKEQIHQHFQQVVYGINQPMGARGFQSAFTNFSYFDKEFFEGMFGSFVFPDGTSPIWGSLSRLQKDFMMWFNEERLKTMLTFPVESFALVYKDGEWADPDMFQFVCDEYTRGHSFFTYISDTVDSLASCCRLRNAVQTKEFNFTNGNIGIMTGSKSVITLNLNRIIQKAHSEWMELPDDKLFYEYLQPYLISILEKVYIFHEAYNEILWDYYNAGMLPVYSAGFIDLDKQYLTVGLNGLNEAAEFLGMECTDNKDYQKFCQLIFSTIKEQNLKHKTKKLTFNTEQVPAESLAIKNYNWDKEDGYWVPENRNLYASYIYIPSDPNRNVLEKIRMHGKDYIGDYLDGGSAAHLNLREHLTSQQYKYLITAAAVGGCQYLTFNIPNAECGDCGFIAKQPFNTCPKCGSKHITLWDRIIGYMTPIKSWSAGRKVEQKTRVYETVDI